MKIKIEATIPTTQYGNLRPTFELEQGDESSVALDSLKELWQRFGESPLKDKASVSSVTTQASTFEKRTTFTGEEVLWNEADHVYTDMAGKVLLSGSKYADQHSPKFDMAMILPKTAKAWGVDESVLKDIWKMNSDISLHWGSAIHGVLELLHKHVGVGEAIATKKELLDNYVTPKQPHLRKVVEDFITKFGLDALPEVLISDVKNEMAGTIDRLEILDSEKKVCRVGDYKTNAEMDNKKRLKYQKQLSFYAQILINHGWTVTGLDLFYLDTTDGWVKEEMEVLSLE